MLLFHLNIQEVRLPTLLIPTLSVQVTDGCIGFIQTLCAISKSSWVVLSSVISKPSFHSRLPHSHTLTQFFLLFCSLSPTIPSPLLHHMSMHLFYQTSNSPIHSMYPNPQHIHLYPSCHCYTTQPSSSFIWPSIPPSDSTSTPQVPNPRCPQPQLLTL